MKSICVLPLFLALSGTISFAQQTDCPRIYKVNDTLKTDPAPTYQWYKNGVIIPNANNIWHKPDTSGNYTVTVGGASTPKSVTLNPANLRVDVFDVKLKPVANATVSVNGKTTTTDGSGRAFLVGVVSGRTVVKVTTNGYFDGYTATYKPASGDALVKIQLEPMPAALTVDAQNGGGVASSTGLNIKFKPNSFINENTGQAYNGTVKVYFHHRAPENDPMFSFAMPGGDFTAIDQNGETVALTSYGFFNAELRGTNGEELNLKPGTTAEVQFRIPENMRTDAPATVPLWYFDETAGTWKYDSELTKSGMFYKGQVSHFSSWNCDYYGPTCTVVASATDCNGNPATNALFCLNQVCGYTDANGNITFINAPADIPITLTTLQDTIHIGIIGEGNTYTLSEPLLAGENMLVFVQYWQDSIEVLTLGAQPPVLYSLDSINWQTEPLFTAVPFQDSVMVWIKDASGCPIKRIAYYTRERLPYLCNPPLNQDEINQYRFYFQNLPPENIPVYKINGCPEDNNQLAYICERYRCLGSLSIRHCSNSYFTSLPPEIGNLNALIQLFLDFNLLTSLPPEIGNLNALIQLWLSNNQLSTLPPEIGNLNALAILLLDYNQLSSLPAEFWNLSNLQILYLNHNQLTSLPAEIGNLNNLHTLYLHNNKLTALPAEIANLANTLQVLRLQNNLIPVQDRPYYQDLLPNTTIEWE